MLAFFHVAGNILGEAGEEEELVIPFRTISVGLSYLQGCLLHEKTAVLSIYIYIYMVATVEM